MTTDAERKAAAEARKAAVDAARAALPVASSSPLGALPAIGDGAGFLGRWVVHQALEDAADALAEDLRALDGVRGVLLVEDRDLVARDWAWAQVTRELERHRTRLETARADLEAAARAVTGTLPDQAAVGSRRDLAARRPTGPTVSPLEVASAHAAAAADVVGLLASEWSVTPSSVDLTTAPLTAAVADRLLAPAGDARASVPVVVDRLRLVPAQGPVHDLLDRTARAAAALGDARRTVATRLPDEADGEADGLVRLRVALADADAADAEWAAGLAALTTAPAGAVPPLAAAAVQSAVHGRDPAVTHVVALSVDSAGADVVARRHLFSPGDRVWLAGGVVVSWHVVRTSDGALVRSRSLRRGRRVRYDLATGRAEGTRPDATTHDGALASPGSPRPSLAELVQVGAVGLVGLLVAAWLAVDAWTRLG